MWYSIRHTKRDFSSFIFVYFFMLKYLPSFSFEQNFLSFYRYFFEIIYFSFRYMCKENFTSTLK